MGEGCIKTNKEMVRRECAAVYVYQQTKETIERDRVGHTRSHKPPEHHNKNEAQRSPSHEGKSSAPTPSPEPIDTATSASFYKQEIYPQENKRNAPNPLTTPTTTTKPLETTALAPPYHATHKLFKARNGAEVVGTASLSG